jgi:hypothetical protein
VWRFIGIYGESKSEEKEKTWQILRTLKHQSDKPWLCAGDFNEILHSWEKEGGVPRAQCYMDRFKEALEFCELDDLGFVGDAFTWRNHSHDAAKYVHERLDREVATQSWRNRFLGYKVINGDPRHSDHCPIIVDTHGSVRPRRGPAPAHMPRFEAKWLEEEGCSAIVENAWSIATDIHGKDVAGAMKGVLGDLREWSRDVLGDLDKRISKIKKRA